MRSGHRNCDFTHLHNHSNYSLLDGASRIDGMIERCRELGMTSLALTDHGNMFGAVQFYRRAMRQGIKPIIGMEAYVAPGSRSDRGRGEGDEYAFHQLLLAEDDVGYRNLMKLSSIGYLEGFYYRPRIDKEVLARHAAGLVATTGCLSSEISHQLLRGDRKGAWRTAGEMVEILGIGNYYVELQDQGLSEQRQINPELLSLARDLDLPVVATNDCHYLRQSDASAHDVLLCIQTGKGISDRNRLRFPNQEFYLKSPDEMARVFHEVPQAIATTREIAERCNLTLKLNEMRLPRFPVPDGRSADEFFEKQVRQGLETRLRRLPVETGAGSRTVDVGDLVRDYEQRLEHEMQTIVKMGFAGYFLIVWDFIRFAREQGIPVGPGRGSAAGSLVAYSLGITDIDPMEYGLVFERFLNPERISLPDIDVDFCMRRRSEVIEYVANKYGRDKVAHIITFGTMAAKAAIRDVGRALEMPYGDVDRIARMIPTELDTTIDGASSSVPALKEAIGKEPRVAELVGLARQIEGQIRHASTHAAGVVIADEPLTEYTPLYKPSSGQGSEQEHFVATQYPMADVEAIGLLKMDFLGLRTLTLVHDTLDSISKVEGSVMTTELIPLDDTKTYEMFADGATSGIFQFESSGMRDALRRLRPTRINDLIAMNALYRPGPIRSGMIDEYVRRKSDPTKVKYLQPELEEILRETYGVIVYQEQVMQIASELAGFSLGEADVLRKAMGKKKPEVMASMEQKFLSGTTRRGVAAGQAREIWNMIVEFAGYGFNKSHSAAYAILAYQTGYLKANYPVHFMAALLSSERDSTAKVVEHIGECREMAIPVLPPDVNESEISFAAVGGSIRFGLAAIKGVGEAAVELILEARQRVGRLDGLVRFCEEVDVRRGLNKRALESLIKAGAMDSLANGRTQDSPGLARSRLLAQLDRAVESGQRAQRDRSSGQANLFADNGTTADEWSPPQEAPECEPLSERQVLAGEKEALGFYITGHPLRRFGDQLRRLANTTTKQLTTLKNDQQASLAGVVACVRDLKTRKGDRMAVIEVEDLEGRAEVVVFPDLFRSSYELLVDDMPVLVMGRCQSNEEAPRMIGTEIVALEAAVRQDSLAAVHQLQILLDLTKVSGEAPEQLRRLLEEHRGTVPVAVLLESPGNQGFRVRIRPNRYLFVELNDCLVEELGKIFGSERVRLLA